MADQNTRQELLEEAQLQSVEALHTYFRELKLLGTEPNMDVYQQQFEDFENSSTTLQTGKTADKEQFRDTSQAIDSGVNEAAGVIPTSAPSTSLGGTLGGVVETTSTLGTLEGKLAYKGYHIVKENFAQNLKDNGLTPPTDYETAVLAATIGKWTLADDTALAGEIYKAIDEEIENGSNLSDAVKNVDQSFREEHENGFSSDAEFLKDQYNDKLNDIEELQKNVDREESREDSEIFIGLNQRSDDYVKYAENKIDQLQKEADQLRETIWPDNHPNNATTSKSNTQANPDGEYDNDPSTPWEPGYNITINIPKEVEYIDQPTSYTIQSGDTLSQIAQDNNTTVDELLRVNPSIENRHLIHPDQELVIPSETETSADRALDTEWQEIENYLDQSVTFQVENNANTFILFPEGRIVESMSYASTGDISAEQSIRVLNEEQLPQNREELLEQLQDAGVSEEQAKSLTDNIDLDSSTTSQEGETTSVDISNPYWVNPTFTDYLKIIVPTHGNFCGPGWI